MPQPTAWGFGRTSSFRGPSAVAVVFLAVHFPRTWTTAVEASNRLFDVDGRRKVTTRPRTRRRPVPPAVHADLARTGVAAAVFRFATSYVFCFLALGNEVGHQTATAPAGQTWRLSVD